MQGASLGADGVSCLNVLLVCTPLMLEKNNKTTIRSKNRPLEEVRPSIQRFCVQLDWLGEEEQQRA